MAMKYGDIDVMKTKDAITVKGDGNLLIGLNTGGPAIGNNNIIIGNNIQVKGDKNFAILIDDKAFNTKISTEEYVAIKNVLLRALGE
jgi:hypothetical protein